MTADKETTAIPPGVQAAAPAVPDVVYYMALERIPGVGSTLAKRLISYCGSAEAIFREKKSVLQKIHGIGALLAQEIVGQQVVQKAEQEYAQLQTYGYRVLCYTDDAYPDRLRQCDDGPVALFVNGTVDFNRPKVLSVVGTRYATAYGIKWCEELLAQMAGSGYSPVIVSGLAYGIDVCAHRAALRHQLPTIAVMATGLDKIYPSSHRATAMKIIEEGGAWATDFFLKTEPERTNFLRRNRIIAGLSDATLVVESGAKGGALITAQLAQSYNRDVLALPGRVTDERSRGCNQLIRNNSAALVETLSDLEYVLGWECRPSVKERQPTLFTTLTADEQRLVDALKDKGTKTIDTLYCETRIPMASLSSILLLLETKGLIRSLPGKQFAWK